MKTPQITTTLGTFGIFSQILNIFGPLTLDQACNRFLSMTVEEYVVSFSPIIVYVWCILFDEKKHFRNKILHNADE